MISFQYQKLYFADASKFCKDLKIDCGKGNAFKGQKKSVSKNKMLCRVPNIWNHLGMRILLYDEWCHYVNAYHEIYFNVVTVGVLFKLFYDHTSSASFPLQINFELGFQLY